MWPGRKTMATQEGEVNNQQKGEKMKPRKLPVFRVSQTIVMPRLWSGRKVKVSRG